MTLDSILTIAAELSVLGIFILQLLDHVSRQRGSNDHDGPHVWRGEPDKPVKFGRESVFTCALGCGTKRRDGKP